MAVEEGLRADTDGAGSCTQQERHSGGQQAPQDVRSWGHGEEAGEGEGVGSPPMWEFYRYFQLGGLVDKEGQVSMWVLSSGRPCSPSPPRASGSVAQMIALPAQGLPASPAATQCHKHSVQRSVGAFPPASPPKQHLGACLDQECRTLAPVPTLGAWAPLAVEQEDGDPLGCCVFARSRGTERSTPSAHGMSASLRLSRIESLASDRSGDMPRELPEELEGGAAGMVSTSMGADAPGGVREPSQVLAAGSAHKRFRRASSRASDGHAAPVLPDTDESGTAPLGTPHKRARVSPSPSPEVTPTRSRADAAPATSPCVIEATPGSPPWTQSGGRTARLAPGTPPVGLASPGMSPIGERSGSQLGRLSSSSGEHENIVGGCGARRASRTIPRTFAGEPWSMSFGDDAAAAPRGEDEARQGDESASAWEDVRTGSQGKDGRRRRGLRGAVPRILFPIEEQGGGGGEGQSKAEVHIGDMEGPPDAPTPRLFGGATATRGFDAPSAGPDSEISAGLRVGGMEGQVEDVVGALDEVLERMGGWQVSEQRAASDGGTGARTSSLSGSDGREADGEAEHDKPGGEKTPVSAVGPGSADVTPPTTGYQARISGPGRGFDGPMSEDGGDSVGGGMEGGAAVQSGFGWWAHTTDMPPQCSEVEVDGKNEEGGRERGEPGVHAGNDTSDTPGKANFGGNAGNVGSAPDCHEGAQDAEQEAARYREGQIGNSGGHGRHPMPFCTCHHCQTCGGVVVPHVFVGAWGSGGQFVTSMGQAARAGDAQQWESWGFQKEREESMGGRRAREGHKQGPRKRGGTDRAAAEDNGGREGVGAWSRAKDGGSVAGGKPIWDFLTQMEMDILFGPRGSGARCVAAWLR